MTYAEFLATDIAHCTECEEDFILSEAAFTIHPDGTVLSYCGRCGGWYPTSHQEFMTRIYDDCIQ